LGVGSSILEIAITLAFTSGVYVVEVRTEKGASVSKFIKE
jgi:hypothetical protein